MAFGALLFLSLLTYRADDPSWNVVQTGPAKNAAGIVGAYLSDFFLQFFGKGAYVLAFLALLFAFITILQRRITLKWFSVLGYICIGLLLSALLHLYLGVSGPKNYSAGGVWGQWLGEFVRARLGMVGGSLLLLISLCISLLWATRFSFLQWSTHMWYRFEPRGRSLLLLWQERALDWRDSMTRWKERRSEYKQNQRLRQMARQSQLAPAGPNNIELPALKLDHSWVDHPANTWELEETYERYIADEDDLPELTPPEQILDSKAFEELDEDNIVDSASPEMKGNATQALNNSKLQANSCDNQNTLISGAPGSSIRKASPKELVDQVTASRQVISDLSDSGEYDTLPEIIPGKNQQEDDSAGGLALQMSFKPSKTFSVPYRSQTPSSTEHVATQLETRSGEHHYEPVLLECSNVTQPENLDNHTLDVVLNPEQIANSITLSPIVNQTPQNTPLPENFHQLPVYPEVTQETTQITSEETPKERTLNLKEDLLKEHTAAPTPRAKKPVHNLTFPAPSHPEAPRQLQPPSTKKKEAPSKKKLPQGIEQALYQTTPFAKQNRHQTPNEAIQPVLHLEEELHTHSESIQQAEEDALIRFALEQAKAEEIAQQEPVQLANPAPRRVEKAKVAETQEVYTEPIQAQPVQEEPLQTDVGLEVVAPVEAPKKRKSKKKKKAKKAEAQTLPELAQLAPQAPVQANTIPHVEEYAPAQTPISVMEVSEEQILTSPEATRTKPEPEVHHQVHTPVLEELPVTEMPVLEEMSLEVPESPNVMDFQYTQPEQHNTEPETPKIKYDMLLDNKAPEEPIVKKPKKTSKKKKQEAALATQTDEAPIHQPQSTTTKLDLDSYEPLTEEEKINSIAPVERAEPKQQAPSQNNKLKAKAKAKPIAPPEPQILHKPERTPQVVQEIDQLQEDSPLELIDLPEFEPAPKLTPEPIAIVESPQQAKQETQKVEEKQEAEEEIFTARQAVDIAKRNLQARKEKQEVAQENAPLVKMPEKPKAPSASPEKPVQRAKQPHPPEELELVAGKADELPVQPAQPTQRPVAPIEKRPVQVQRKGPDLGQLEGQPVIKEKLRASSPNLNEISKPAKPAWQLRGYEPPSLDFLAYEAPPEDDVIPEILLENAKKLEKALENFSIRGKVKEILPGPVITLYEYLPAPGIKVSKIAALADDIAMALKAYQVRVIAPIPGRGVVGVEVPNMKREMVFLKELLADEQFVETGASLPVALGKDTTGHPFVANLAKMPHLLVAGTTGSGKSVGVNTMICSLLYNSSPEEVRFLMVDPKMLELSIYDGIPHLLLPVMTEAKKASVALNWAVSEMERRYALMAGAGVRSIAKYNELIKKRLMMRDTYLARDKMDSAALQDVSDWEDEDFDIDELLQQDGSSKDYFEKLPYIVVIIDELADLMMVAAKEVEFAIARLAQMARAAGIHLIIATQRPSVDVLTGVIKANFPTRMAFRVGSKIDSRTIIDQPGAEKLLGSGDMLFVPPGSSAPTRLHGAFVSEEEIHKIVKHLKKQGAPEYKSEILASSEPEEGEEDEPVDELYDKAVAIVIKSRNASISSLQRKLRIGYNRSARIIEYMEKEGVIGPQVGSKPREILVPAEGE